MRLLLSSIFDDNHWHWTKLEFRSDDGKKITRVYAGASEEYTEDLFGIKYGAKVSRDHLIKWRESVAEKWTQNNNILESPIHYDVYTNTTDGQEKIFNKLQEIPKRK